MPDKLPPVAARYQPRHKFAPLWRDIVLLWQIWSMRRQTRRALGRLEAAQLDDIALTKDAAHRESEKAFWQA